MKPNILFILIDGLRSDRCYGKHKTSITPNIDSLITNGVYFEQAICSAPVTSPSMSSILTGLYPFESVILDNGIFMMNLEKENYVKTSNGSKFKADFQFINLSAFSQFNFKSEDSTRRFFLIFL